MTDDQHRRLWIRAFAVCEVATPGAMAVALITKSAAGVVVVLVLSPMLMVLLLLTMPRRRVVPPHLQGLDDEQRRLVAALADTGARAPDPVLAEAVVAQARRQRTGHIILLASGTAPVGLRLPDVLAGDADPVDTVLVVVWMVLAGFLIRGLVRTTRAIAVKR
jgi:hypothetical protein